MVKIDFCWIAKSFFRSAAYFSALSSGDTLPVKRRLEPFSSDGITMGNLEVLVQQYKGQNQEVTKKDLEQKWGKADKSLLTFNFTCF
jgi:hypothetical protein